MQVWLSLWSEVQMICIAYGPADANATPSLDSLKLIQIGLTLWCRVTQVVLEKRPLNGCLPDCLWQNKVARCRPDTRPLPLYTSNSLHPVNPITVKKSTVHSNHYLILFNNVTVFVTNQKFVVYWRTYYTYQKLVEATVCRTCIHDVVFGRPFVKRFALCYRSVVCPLCPVCLSCPVCDVRALWPNGWTDQDETRQAIWPGPRPTSLPSGILIHLTIWPQLAMPRHSA